MSDMEHRAPWECTFAEEDKSECKAGVSPGSDREYFEILSLCIVQAGLNWGMIRKNWARFKHGFFDFDVAKLSKAQAEELLKETSALKNRKKVEAIIHNAKEFQKIKVEHGSFSNFLKSLKTMEDKDALKALTRRFKHVGEYTAEYFLHSVGYWKC
ncbi:MAG: 3-methyl-adenine DNA glycosylase I [Candidatus Bathyarchaeota archaeon BA1]|nr:MAG: 3-methyl-adenine DNA glycosylase I [Candidatus Bathyarchaeota archaeon BA1]